jgi:two-component system response regulator DevR
MQASALSPAPVRVFVVEDSEQIRRRLDDLIAQAGAQTAGHAAEVEPATRAILETHPDVVILDLQLADGSGFDVLRAVRDAAPDIDKSKEFERVRDVLAERSALTHH